MIGYDAKVQVDFDPNVVARYRLIGYENRAIADEDFRNDAVDAGEVGAGHSITALYEVELKDAAPADVIATAYIRYQDAETRQVVEMSESLIAAAIHADFADAPPNLRLHAAVAEFAELLRGSREQSDYAGLLEFAKGIEDTFPQQDEVQELLDLIRLAGRYHDQ